MARWCGRRAGWLAGLVLCLFIAGTGGLARVDGAAYDLFVPRIAAQPRSVIVAVDEASVAALGRWPWPRARHAELIDRLRVAGASGIGYAVLFTEASDAQDDERLAGAVRRFTASGAPLVLAMAPVPAASAPVGAGGVAELLPLQALRDAGARLGHADVEADPGGVLRRLYLAAGVGQPRHPALAAALLPVVPAGHSVATLTGAGSLAWQREREVLLPRLGHTAPVWSFSQALSSPAFAAAVRGRVVWVGVTAAGLGPSWVSPLFDAAEPVPAVRWHAEAFEALASGAQIVPWTPGRSWALTLALMLLPLCWREPARWPAIAVAVACAALPWALSAAVLHGAAVWWAPSAAGLGLLLTLLVWLARGSVVAVWRLHALQRAAQVTLDAIGEGVVEVDADGLVQYANPTACRLLGLPESGLAQPRAWQQVLALEPASRERLAAALAAVLRSRRALPVGGHLCVRGAGGGSDDETTEVVLRATVAPRWALPGRHVGWVLALGDVTEAVAAHQRLDHAATHDALTGLPNRRLLEDRLEQALLRRQRQGGLLAVLFIDLDRFKRINDSLGHEVGDRVLLGCAERMRHLLRARDTLARWGGDEFIVLLEDLASREQMAPLVQRIVAACATPMAIGRHGALTCAASVGVAIAPLHGDTAAALIAQADTAMYAAKRLGGSRSQVASSHQMQWTEARLAMETDLRASVAGDGLVMHYQPVWHADGQRLAGLEALVRWQRESTLLLPDEFLALAEEAGLMPELGSRVCDLALRDMARWRTQGLQPVPVAVNLSARQCLNWALVDQVRGALQRHGLAGAGLKLEITEQAALADVAYAAGLFVELKSLGVQLSLDDFGTGYSSLAHLRQFPVDELKIDRSFVAGMLRNSGDAAIVRATIALAHELGLKVVGEGVETPAQRDFLVSQGCDLLQGYLLGRPVPAEAVAGYLLERV